MSKQEFESEDERAGGPVPRGPNLLLIYGLMLIGLLVAIGVATLVVWPFYQHRH